MSKTQEFFKIEDTKGWHQVGDPFAGPFEELILQMLDPSVVRRPDIYGVIRVIEKILKRVG